jgi:hypothetical protein
MGGKRSFLNDAHVGKQDTELHPQARRPTLTAWRRGVAARAQRAARPRCACCACCDGFKGRTRPGTDDGYQQQAKHDGEERAACVG